MRRVILESPYRATTTSELCWNNVYAKAALRDCLRRNESPLVSHLLFAASGALDDGDPDERALGIAAGLAWGSVADATVVYTDRGISDGMKKGITQAQEEGRPVEYRQLAGWGGPT